MSLVSIVCCRWPPHHAPSHAHAGCRHGGVLYFPLTILPSNSHVIINVAHWLADDEFKSLTSFDLTPWPKHHVHFPANASDAVSRRPGNVYHIVHCIKIFYANQLMTWWNYFYTTHFNINILLLVNAPPISNWISASVPHYFCHDVLQEKAMHIWNLNGAPPHTTVVANVTRNGKLFKFINNLYLSLGF